MMINGEKIDIKKLEFLIFFVILQEIYGTIS